MRCLNLLAAGTVSFTLHKFGMDFVNTNDNLIIVRCESNELVLSMYTDYAIDYC